MIGPCPPMYLSVITIRMKTIVTTTSAPLHRSMCPTCGWRTGTVPRTACTTRRHRGRCCTRRLHRSRTASVAFKRRQVLMMWTFVTLTGEVVSTVMITGSIQRIAIPGPGDIVNNAFRAAGLAKASVICTRRVWTAGQRGFRRWMTVRAPSSAG